MKGAPNDRRHRPEARGCSDGDGQAFLAKVALSQTCRQPAEDGDCHLQQPGAIRPSQSPSPERIERPEPPSRSHPEKPIWRPGMREKVCPQ